jgi:hypothetical protein
MEMKKEKRKKVDLFLDSGAFSAWTQGITIDINEYIDFIKQHQDIIQVYANLDVIAEKSGIANKKESAEKTLKNQKIMEEAGLNPLPVFHIGEPLKYLQYYIKNYKYIALGGMVGISKTTLISWLDTCFSQYICNSSGIPNIKIHGFGLTSLLLMLRYPWYSVDSTSWVIAGRLGAIYVPRYRKDDWIYDENSWKVSVSSRSPDKKDAGQHIDTLPPKQKEIILDYIHAKGYKLGISRFEETEQSHELKDNERWADKKPKDKTAKRLLEIIEEDGVSNRYQLRDEMNIIYFQDLERSIPDWPQPFKQKSVNRFEL